MEFVLAWMLAPFYAVSPARPVTPMVPLHVKDGNEAGVVWRTLAERWRTP